MEQTTNLFKNKILLFRAKSVRLEKMFPVSQIRRALPINLQKIVILSMNRSSSLSDRIRIASNFFQSVIKMNKHHGSFFTVKWLKANQVALQKYLGDDRLNSLRDLEPNLPLPRLINGCPAIINRHDRSLIRSGNANLTRFWLSLFGSYRIMSILGKTKLDTIYSPFKGSSESVLDLISLAKTNPFFKRLDLSKLKMNLGPRTLVLSHKSSPSNSMSYQGIISDYFLLTRGNELQKSVYNSINYYLSVISKVHSVRRWDSLIYGLESITSQLEFKNLKFKKSINRSNGLSQFAIKEEAAGKIRVFALIDSISQSVLRPLHDYLFDLLRHFPNDGTFNQDLSVKRSIEKSKLYSCAYSFDLSAATDRLPRSLTGAILEGLVGLDNFSIAWQSLMADRIFCFSNGVKKKFPHLLEDQNNMYKYSVGQPMGGLSSWAGLAITHHWILQYCSWSLGNYTKWEDRYEVLGDDIVIFDHLLATKYLQVMNDLGVDINMSKSISSPTKQVFEFAKRTIVTGINVSSISFQQLISQSSLGSRVADSVTWIQSNLINNVPTLGSILSKKGGANSWSKVKLVGMESLSLLGLLFHKGLIEHRVVVESLINPQYKEDFDWDKASFTLPLRSILKKSLSCLKGEDINHIYPFSHESLRKEVYRELRPELSAVILQLALHKIKLLNRDYDSLLYKGSNSLFIGINDSIFKASVNGFFEDLIINLSPNFDVLDMLDKVENTLYLHAKIGNVSIPDALSLLDEVEVMIFKFTYKTDISRLRYESEKSPIIELLRKGVLGSKTKYWENSPDY